MSNSRLRVPLAHLDATWLTMDEPTNPMVINCVMFLPERIAYDQLVDILNKRMIARFNRFSQRIVRGRPGLDIPHWEPDPYFDIRSHVHHLALPEPGGEVELQRLIGMLMSEPLERTRPLWRMYLIDNLGDGCAVFGRIHHAIGDGIGLMQVVLSFTDPEPGATRSSPAEATAAKTRGGTASVVRGPVRMAGMATASLIKAAQKRRIDPVGARQATRDALSTFKAGGLLAAAASVNLARLALMPSDRKSVYRGELTPIKRVAWSPSLPLSRIKQIGKATGTTINDVLVAAVSGGLRNYMIAADGHAPSTDIRATVPVNLRAPDAPLTLGNRFSMVFLTLPIASDDPRQRLATVKRRMDALKRSPEPKLVYDILTLAGMVPAPVSRPVTAWFASKATCLLTNVPGPRRPVYFAGKPVDRMMFWVPQSRGMGLGVSILSYAGEVTIGVMADEALVPEPQRLVEHICADLDVLERMASTTAAGGSNSE